jgi:RNA 2',3'-cyclic 3'-phosphodiesterase
MAVIRSFVATLIDAGVKDNISLAQCRLKKLSSTGVKWVARDSFHVTLKFLGNVDEVDLPAIEEALVRAARTVEPFEAQIMGLGAFPNWRKAHVLWAGMRRGAEQYSGLAQAVDTELSKLGFATEKGPFRAHVTIGRVKDKPINGMKEAAQEWEQRDLGTMRVSQIALMRSDITRDGSVHTVLRTIELGSTEDT